MSLTVRDIIGILIMYQSLVFGLSLVFNKKSKPLFVKALLTFCTLIILHFGYMFFEKNELVNQVLLGPFFGLLYGPVYYVYTKSLIVAKSYWKKISLHFIPALIILLVLFYLGNHPGHTFIIIGVLVTIHFMTYLCISLRLLYKYRKQLADTTSSFYNISLFWLERIIYLNLAAILVMLLESYFQSLRITEVLILIIYALALILIHCFYYLGLKQVRLFKGLKDENIATKEYKISAALFDQYLHQLNAYLAEEQPYLEYNLSLQDLSDRLSISPRNLSHIINKRFKKNFHDFINTYRLELVKKYLKESDQSIKAIMYESGFSNRATFNAIFKKNTGLTPTQFREKHKS